MEQKGRVYQGITSENGQVLTRVWHAGIRAPGSQWVTGRPGSDPKYMGSDPYLVKMPFGIFTCTPTFWSTSWVMTTLPATLVSW